MGTSFTSPASFVAATKAKAAEVNAKFSDIFTGLSGGGYDPWLNGCILNPLSNGNVNVTSSACYVNAAHTIDTNATYTLKTSTSKMVILGYLAINTGGSLNMTSGSELIII